MIGGMLGHIGLNVPDLAAAKSYYDELLPLLGYVPFIADEDQFAYCPAEGKRGTYLFVYPALEPSEYSRHRSGLQHLAFMVPTRTAVRAAHEKAVALGNEVVEVPRSFPEYGGPYFATFWLDPHGFMLEAVCHKDAD
jgi:catechol 2,3-dioxygenase-like lactoylglutathione lyase family enzyme